jgi:hypothetical protein
MLASACFIVSANDEIAAPTLSGDVSNVRSTATERLSDGTTATALLFAIRLSGTGFVTTREPA